MHDAQTNGRVASRCMVALQSSSKIMFYIIWYIYVRSIHYIKIIVLYYINIVYLQQCYNYNNNWKTILWCEIKHFNSYTKCVITGQPWVKIQRASENNMQMKVKS